MDIELRIKKLIEYERTLTNLLNDIWAEKTALRDEYKRITGKAI